MSRNAISANPEHYIFYIFKIFRGSMPRTPIKGLKKFFSHSRVAQIFFQDRLPPPKKRKTKNPRENPDQGLAEQSIGVLY